MKPKFLGKVLFRSVGVISVYFKIALCFCSFFHAFKNKKLSCFTLAHPFPYPDFSI